MTAPSPPGPPRDDELVPARFLAAARQRALDEPVVMRTPLSQVAAAFYAREGSWNLALELAEQTGLPIEVAFVRGRPARAYVVDDDAGRAYGVWGEQWLRTARTGADRLRGPMRPADLLGELRRYLSPELAELVRSDELRVPARRAASVVLAAIRSS